MQLKTLTDIKNSDLSSLADEAQNKLLNGERYLCHLNSEWSKSFPAEAGVYAGFRNDKLIYIGETAKLNERMGEAHRTYMHPLRKKLGKLVFKAELEKNKFSEEIEQKLDALYEQEMSFSFMVLPLGRLEIESVLIHRHKSKLLNNVGKRNILPL